MIDLRTREYTHWVKVITDALCRRLFAVFPKCRRKQMTRCLGCSEPMELIVASSASKWFDNCTRSDCRGCISDEHGHHMQHHVQQSILCCVGTDGECFNSKWCTEDGWTLPVRQIHHKVKPSPFMMTENIHGRLLQMRSCSVWKQAATSRLL